MFSSSRVIILRTIVDLPLLHRRGPDWQTYPVYYIINDIDYRILTAMATISVPSFLELLW